MKLKSINDSQFQNLEKCNQSKIYGGEGEEATFNTDGPTYVTKNTDLWFVGDGTLKGKTWVSDMEEVMP